MEHKFVLTCFKRKGDKSGDTFINSYGSSRSEWDLLKEDASLISLKTIFELVEYDDIRSLQNGYDKKVDRSLYIDLRHESDFDTSIVYTSTLLATHIAAFTIEFAKRYEISNIVIKQSVPDEKAAIITSEAIQTGPLIPAPEPSFANSWKLPATIVGGVMFLMLVAGAVIFFDWRRRKGSKLHSLTPFFLSDVPEKAEHVNFGKEKKRESEEAEL